VVVEAMEVEAEVKVMVEVMVVSLEEDIEEEEVDEEGIKKPSLTTIIIKMNGPP
jgi:hypothetical protein